jgi:SAM-dependent methyltransferase
MTTESQGSTMAGSCQGHRDARGPVHFARSMLIFPACGICDGRLELLHHGSDAPAGPAALSPTNHTPGEHGDLYRCAECGSVHQPAVPDGNALADLYRDMDDDAYLGEEAGRRETANRLLDLISPLAPGRRLLDVGCGHGLLLAEAQRRGFQAGGLELSRASAAHAREHLGLEVEELTLSDYAATKPGQFDAIVLADVIEHVDDPLGTLDLCRDLLGPDGVLCVVTPDPSSLVARGLGARWWGYLPGHKCLIPRLTLRELLSERGLVTAHDEAFVRTFSARYWVDGLAERGGSLGKLAGGIARALPATLKLSAPLFDERVMVAVRSQVQAAPEPLVTDRGGPGKVHVVLPAYKATRTIPLVVGELPTDAADRALLVDDASPDATVPTALENGLDVLRHPTNRGYGANQKTCYSRAALDGAAIVVMVHADHQYDARLLASMVAPIEEGRADVVIGSRLLEDEAIAGGMPRWKWVGNRFLTGLENLAFSRSYSEYHTGYRAFSVDFLRTIPFLRNADGFSFDQEIFAQIVARDARVVELAIPTRYFHEASSVAFRASVVYGLRTLAVLARYRVDVKRGRWALLRKPAARLLPREAEPAGERQAVSF